MQRFNRFKSINKNKMSLQAKEKNVRVLSARVVKGATDRARPMSGIPNQSYTRKQMIINSYNSQGADTNRAKSARLTTTNVFPQNFQTEKNGRRPSVNLPKEKQQMTSQIIGLKQTVNRLVEQLTHEKGKVEKMRKRDINSINIIDLTRDQKQWTSQIFNKHLVSGVRGLYDEIKQKYEAKCQELDNVIKKESISRQLEREQYVKALEDQVKSLKKRIENKNEGNIDSIFYTETQRTANKIVVADLQNEIGILTEKLKDIKTKLTSANKELRQKQLKISIDQSLILQKDNDIHALTRKNKQLSKQLMKTKELNLLLDKELTQIKEKYQKEVEAHQQTVVNYQEKCKRDVEAVTKSKDSRIQTLQADNSYLNKMIHDLRSTNLELNKLSQELREENIRNSRRGNDEHAHRQVRAAERASNRIQTRVEQPNVPYQNGRRIPQKADRKYNEGAIKTRKIQLVDVLEVSEFLRLKLIAEQFSIQSVKSLFDAKQASKSQWQKQYITMKEVKQIFKETPFNLEQDDAVLISRYLIQDVQEDYVYCDESNQNHRQVVKSIVKTLIQEYPVYKEDSAEYYEMQEEVSRYKNNLRSALKTIAKEGVISKPKLVDVMKGIGMEVAPAILQLILATLAKKSKSLNALNYPVLF